MCTTYKWNSISAMEKGNILYIIATRSDGLIIRLINNLVPVEENLAKQFKSIITLLESYRNCKCKEGESCINHKPNFVEEKET